MDDKVETQSVLFFLLFFTRPPPPPLFKPITLGGLCAKCSHHQVTHASGAIARLRFSRPPGKWFFSSPDSEVFSFVLGPCCTYDAFSNVCCTLDTAYVGFDNDPSPLEQGLWVPGGPAEKLGQTSFGAASDFLQTFISRLYGPWHANLENDEGYGRWEFPCPSLFSSDFFILIFVVDATDALQALQSIWTGYLLSPFEIYRWDFLCQDLKIQQTQLRIFWEELQSFAAGRYEESTLKCALCIISSPFPAVATRGRSIESPHPLIVQLLTGATVDILAATAVQAEAVVPKGSKGKATPDLLDMAPCPLSADSRHAELRVKFANGTRKHPVQFQFHVELQLRTPAGARVLELVR